MRIELAALALVVVAASILGWQAHAPTPPPAPALTPRGWHVHGVRPGMTEGQVLALVGSPLGKKTNVFYAQWSIPQWVGLQRWEYGQWTVLFKRGKVVGVDATAVEYAGQVSVNGSQEAEEVFGRPPVRLVILKMCINDVTSFWRLNDSTILGSCASLDSTVNGRLVLLPPFQVEVPTSMWGFWEAAGPTGKYQPISAGRRIDTSQFPLAVRRP